MPIPNDSLLSTGNIISIATSIVGFIYIVFGLILDVKTRLTKLETQMAPWSELMVKAMGALIHQPHSHAFRKDDLIDRFMSDPKHLSLDEVRELKKILEEESPELERQKDPKIIAYAYYRGLMDREIKERLKPEKKSKLYEFCKLLNLCR
jgi:hypothetical protein